jgi:proteasome lid subunit RPN8/RPN11
VELHADTVAALFDHAERERPREAVAALIIGEGLEAFYPLTNVAPDDEPGFALPLDEQAWLYVVAAAPELELVLFHSHVDAACYPSRADLRHADEGSRHVILSLRTSELRLFRYVRNDDDRIRGRLRAREEPLAVVTLPDAATAP